MKKKDLVILKKINAEAIAKYGDKLWKDVPKAPVMNDMIDKALTKHRDMFTDEQLEKYEAMKNSGMLQGTRREEDPKTAAKIHKYVEKRIKEEVDAGNLTKPEDKKVKQYEQRAKKSVK